MTTQTIATTTLSDTELMAYYKRIAPVEDVKFHIERCDHDVDLHRGFVELLTVLESKGGKATPATRAEYQRLCQTWRARRNAADRAAQPAAPKTSEASWNIYYRNTAGKLFASQGGKFIECAGTTCPAIVRAMPAHLDKSKPKATKHRETAPPSPTVETVAPIVPEPVAPAPVHDDAPVCATRVCILCKDTLPIAAFVRFDPTVTRNVCTPCRREQQRAARQRKRAA